MRTTLIMGMGVLLAACSLIIDPDPESEVFGNTENPGGGAGTGGSGGTETAGTGGTETGGTGGSGGTVTGGSGATPGSGGTGGPAETGGSGGVGPGGEGGGPAAGQGGAPEGGTGGNVGGFGGEGGQAGNVGGFGGNVGGEGGEGGEGGSAGAVSPTPGPGELYAKCDPRLDGADCNGDLFCHNNYRHCTYACEDDWECSQPTDTVAEAECSFISDSCVLMCDNHPDCLVNMKCSSTIFGACQYSGKAAK